MTVALFDILGREKPRPQTVADIGDFTLRPAGTAKGAAILSSPDWSLYTLDFPTRQAVLVELPQGTDLSQAPFVYALQFSRALRVALLPFDQFIALSKTISPKARLAFLYSTGRCGSTLASRILAQLPEVWSLSEPDYLSTLAFRRLDISLNESVALAKAATVWTCRPPKARSPEVIVIKPRSEVTLIADACHRAFPDAHSLFMYRDLLGFANSAFKFGQRVLGQDAYFADPEGWRPLWTYLMVGTPIGQLDTWFASDHGPVRWEELNTLMWMVRIDGYLAAFRQGMTFTAIHYADLVQSRETETARLLTGCGVSTRHLAKAMAGFVEDSHKGAGTANSTAARSLNAEERHRAATLLERLGRRDYLTERLPDSGAA